MNQEEQNYLDLLKNILDNGSDREDRTGIGTKSIFGTQLRFSLENDKIPMLTTKKMFSKGVIEELLFFLRGETDTKILENKGVKIWIGNTSREFLDKRELKYLPEGDMGKGYGFQWRKFGEQEPECNNDDCRIDTNGVDQVAQVINTLKTNPTDRRIIISAWNPKQLNEAALPPCHMMAQFYANKNKLSCQFIMRSVDTLLGLPFNILSYAILTKIIAKAVNMEPKEIIFVGGDTHVYASHFQQAKEQISRKPFKFPTMIINKPLYAIEDIEALQLADFAITGYEHHSAIKAKMCI